MKKKILILLIVLSFIAPSLHFVLHKHSYNPFTKHLEHQNSENILDKSNYSNNYQIQKVSKFNIEDDICNISLNNNFYQIKNIIYVHILTYQNYFIQNQKLFSEILYSKLFKIAPKNSPPIYS